MYLQQNNAFSDASVWEMNCHVTQRWLQDNVCVCTRDLVCGYTHLLHLHICLYIWTLGPHTGVYLHFDRKKRTTHYRLPPPLFSTFVSCLVMSCLWILATLRICARSHLHCFSSYAVIELINATNCVWAFCQGKCDGWKWWVVVFWGAMSGPLGLPPSRSPSLSLIPSLLLCDPVLRVPASVHLI